EDDLGVLGREEPAAVGHAGLEDQRRTLHTRVPQRGTGAHVVFTDVVDLVDLRGVNVDAGLPVADHRVVLPRTLPELVADIHELLGGVVTLRARGRRWDPVV